MDLTDGIVSSPPAQGTNGASPGPATGDYKFDYPGVLIRVPSGRGQIATLSVDGISVPPGEPVPPFDKADTTLAD